MALSTRNKAILQAEITKPAYDGMTAESAREFLFAPYSETVQKTVTPPMLTPRNVAALVGPMKAEAIAAALKQAFPNIAGLLMEVGIDPENADAQAFLTSLKNAGVLTQADLDKLTPQTVDELVTRRPRGYSIFSGASLSSLEAAAGVAPQAPNEPGFPNTVKPDDFAAAWLEVRN